MPESGVILDEKDLENRIYQMSDDITEVLTTMRHFDSRMASTQDQIKELQDISKDNEREVYQLKSDMDVMKSRQKYQSDEIKRLDTELDDKEKKQQNDRKAIISTILTVVSIIIAFGGFLIKLYGG